MSLDASNLEYIEYERGYDVAAARSYALLEGARGQAPVDLDALAAALQRISQLATDYPEITELDLNPFIVGPAGSEAYVADARMSLSAR